MELRKLCKDDYDELLYVLNTTFGNKYKKEVDFLTTQPKMWVRDDEHMSRHIGVIEDGKLVAVGGIYPLRLVVDGTPILLFTTGNIATLPEYEGRGYFTKIFTELVSMLDTLGADGARLGGARQRYGRFGYEPAGLAYKFSFNEDNRRKYFKDRGEDIEFKLIERTDEESLLFCNRLGRESRFYVIRSEEDKCRDVYLALTTKHSLPYLALRGGEPIGYLSANADGVLVGAVENGRNITEIRATSKENYIDIISAWQRHVGVTVVVNVSPHLEEELDILIKGAEAMSISSPSHFKIINYEKIANAFFKLKDPRKMLDGEAVLGIEGYGNLLFSKKGDSAVCTLTERDADITLDRAEATRAIFGHSPSIKLKSGSPLLASWFPLPLSWDTLDYT